MKTVKIGLHRYRVSRIVESQEEPIGTPGLLWIHYDPTSRVKLYFLWKCCKWLNVGAPDTCCDCCCDCNTEEED